MDRAITTLDNSKWKKDYNKYFYFATKFSTQGERIREELSNEIFDEIFTLIDSIVVFIPVLKKSLDVDLGKVVDESCNAEIKSLESLREFVIHSEDIHKIGRKCSIGDTIHFFKFEDYSEIDKFLDWLDMGDEQEVKVYTTLVNERENKTEAMTIQNIHKEKKVDKSIHTTNNDNRTHTEVHTDGSFNKVNVGSKVKSGKSWWSKLIGFFK